MCPWKNYTLQCHYEGWRGHAGGAATQVARLRRRGDVAISFFYGGEIAEFILSAREGPRNDNFFKRFLGQYTQRRRHGIVMRLNEILRDIKIQHTVFAMPFAFMSAFIAADGWPGWELFAWIALAMFFARSAAMAFNRLVDADFDRLNPRTKNRALPAGLAAKSDYALFTVLCGAGFVGVCWMINPLAFRLSFPALLIVFFYSYTKRFTAYSHFFLGLALALAPVGAWVAVKEEIALAAAMLGAAVVFWLAGLDTIYACQDVGADRRLRLNSIPSRFGVARALKLAAAFHGVMIALLLTLPALAPLSWVYVGGVLFTAAMLENALKG